MIFLPQEQLILRAQENLLCPQESRARPASKHVQDLFLLCKSVLLVSDLSSNPPISVGGNLPASTMSHLPRGEAEASNFLLHHEEINKVITKATQGQRVDDEVTHLVQGSTLKSKFPGC